MKLSLALKGIKKVIETEGDLNVKQIVIKKDKFWVQIKSTWFDVDNYDKLINSKENQSV